MKKRILFPLTAIALTLSANGFASERTEEAKTNDLIGLGSGAAAGALVAGPVGAVVGAILGIYVADDINDTNALEKSHSDLAKSQAQLAHQDSQLVSLQQRYEQVVEEKRVQLVAMDKEIERVMQDIESHVLFRTASYQIEAHFKPQLDLVAKGLKDNPELLVTLSGFADSRGDDTYNQALSQQRAISVKDYLLSQGVSDKQVLTSYHGESQPVSAQATREDFFFDRRVLVKVAQGQQSMTASTL